MLIDDFAIADVDERSKVSDSHRDRSKSPKRDEANQPVTSKGSSESLSWIRIVSGQIHTNTKTLLSCTYSNGVGDILGEENALELDQEEVD